MRVCTGERVHVHLLSITSAAPPCSHLYGENQMSDFEKVSSIRFRDPRYLIRLWWSKQCGLAGLKTCLISTEFASLEGKHMRIRGTAEKRDKDLWLKSGKEKIIGRISHSCTLFHLIVPFLLWVLTVQKVMCWIHTR